MLSLPCTRGAAILAAALIAFTATACDGATKPEAREGSIDLTKVDFSKSSPVSLRGEWTAVLPDGREGSLAVPGNWKGQSVGGSALGGFGSLTYRLEVRLGENPGNLSLRLGEIGTASVVYLNGRVVAENGRVGEKADSMPAVGIRYVGIPEGSPRPSWLSPPPPRFSPWSCRSRPSSRPCTPASSCGSWNSRPSTGSWPRPGAGG